MPAVAGHRTGRVVVLLVLLLVVVVVVVVVVVGKVLNMIIFWSTSILNQILRHFHDETFWPPQPRLASTASETLKIFNFQSDADDM